MTVTRLILALGAVLCGVRAMGYWVMLRIGGVPPAERDGIALTACASALVFVMLSLVSAYLRERPAAARKLALNTLYLIAAHGLLPIALFTMASKGAVLRMPEALGLLVLFVVLALVQTAQVAQASRPASK